MLILDRSAHFLQGKIIKNNQLKKDRVMYSKQSKTKKGNDKAETRKVIHTLNAIHVYTQKLTVRVVVFSCINFGLIPVQQVNKAVRIWRVRRIP